MSTAWQKRYQAASAAIKAQHFAEAEALVAELHAEASSHDDPQLQSGAYFCEGMLRDAVGQLESAEEAFVAALAAW